jgi:hypothetical protein
MCRGLPAVSKGSRRLSEWCRSNKFDLNAGKCKSISFRRNMRPIEFVYSINRTALERVDEIKDLGVIMDGKIEAIISKSSRMLGFIKRISRDFRDPYTHKTLYISLVRPQVGRLTSRFILSGLSGCNTILFVMRCVDCHGECDLCQLMMQDAF